MLVTLVWVAFVGIRGDIGGADYFAYRAFYSSINGFQGLEAFGWEPLFLLLGMSSKSLGLSFNQFLGLVGILGILPAVYVINKRSDSSPIGLFVYGVDFMLYGSFVILRAGIAIGLAFLVVDFLCEKKWSAALIAALVATGFHASATVLILYFLLSVELRPLVRTWLWYGAGTLGLVLLALSVSGIGSTINLGIARRLFFYLGNIGIETINPLNIVEILLAAFLVFRYSPRANPVLVNGFLSYMAFALLATLEAVFVRAGSFFRLVLPLLYPGIARAEPEGWLEKRFGTGTIQLFIFGYYLLKVTRWLILNGGDTPGSGAFTPYRTFWHVSG
ncbi:MAG: EpsG family protein [Rectinemataceae bacterium]